MRSIVVGALAVLALGGMGARDNSSADLSGHPLVGSWAALTPFGASAETFFADGSFIAGYPAVEQGPMGAAFYSAGVGVWESTGPRSGHFTSVQGITDASGADLGTLTIEGHLNVSEDGERFVDDSAETFLTYRDATGAVIAVIRPFQGDGPKTPVTGTRMSVGKPGVPEGTASEATPSA